MKVIELKYKDDLGNIMIVDELKVLKDKGIEADINSKKGNREISILFLEKKEDIKNKDYRGICTKKFYENIIIEGLNINLIKVGKKLNINDVVIEITSMGKECFDECILLKENKKCILVYNVAFAKVIEEGKIQTQNKVKIVD